MNKENYANRLVQYLKKSLNPVNSEIKQLIENEDLWWASKGSARYLLDFQQKVIWYFPYGFYSISATTIKKKIVDLQNNGWRPITQEEINQIKKSKWGEIHNLRDKNWFISQDPNTSKNSSEEIIRVCNPPISNPI